MKKILSVIMGVLLFAGAFTPQNSNAATVFVEIGDRPGTTRMVAGIGTADIAGAGYRDIGAGVIITGLGFTGITSAAANKQGKIRVRLFV